MKARLSRAFISEPYRALLRPPLRSAHASLEPRSTKIDPPLAFVFFRSHHHPLRPPRSASSLTSPSSRDRYDDRASPPPQGGRRGVVQYAAARCDHAPYTCSVCSVSVRWNASRPSHALVDTWYGLRGQSLTEKSEQHSRVGLRGSNGIHDALAQMSHGATCGPLACTLCPCACPLSLRMGRSVAQRPEVTTATGPG